MCVEAEKVLQKSIATGEKKIYMKKVLTDHTTFISVSLITTVGGGGMCIHTSNKA